MWQLAAPALAASPLGPATQSIDQLLPGAVVDSISLPDRPLRVASRPQPTKDRPRPAARPRLDWRPGLIEASEELSKEGGAAEDRPADTPLAEPDSLRPVMTTPTLVAPRTDTASPPVDTVKPRTENKKPEAKAEPEAEPAPSRKPPVQPRLVKPAPKAVERPAPVGKPAAEPSSKAKAEPETRGEPAKTRPAAKPAPPAEPPAPLSRSLRNLRSRMRTVLSYYYRQPMNTAQYDSWEIMHGMLTYELHSRVLDGGPGSKPITAIGHLCFNRPTKRGELLFLNERGELDARVGVGVQGHKGQFLAMLAQCNVSPEYPIRVAGKDFTIHDLVEAEQRSCQAKTELTFKLIGLGHYLDSDAEWVNEQGETWDIPRLIKEEREQPIRGAACGGTHRLGGLSLAFRRREARGEPLDGEYAEAARFVSQYQTMAFRLQNQDGSLSTEWFRGRGDEEDIERRLRTTGHTMEWLAYSLPDEQLVSYRTVKAVNYLTGLLATNANQEWHPGSLAHALHALVVYDKRVFQPHDAADSQGIASAGERVDPTARLYRGYSIYRGVMRNSAPESSGLFGLFGGSQQTRKPTGYRSR